MLLVWFNIIVIICHFSVSFDFCVRFVKYSLVVICWERVVILISALCLIVHDVVLGVLPTFDDLGGIWNSTYWFLIIAILGIIENTDKIYSSIYEI